ncbi:glycoside hydrolase family 38 C-terminal domain-containing protein [Vagococcus carniphilus]|uniref:glycoside hydrolase family 38 N-terminal domain-containing protein n=1 Tax=Vagococcus carniphilus TaxID=218144 RepID=UPI003B59FD5E
MKKKVHVVHHTHWDFEWYFTNHESFVQLSYHMDEVMSALENNLIDFYLLDGQLSIVDEYLQSFPEQKERLVQLVKAEKLFIGPWYTQTDELIIAGESIVRNLDLGITIANELGGYFKAGYLPDSFGQGKDMPKIYQGFGLDKTVFWRGVPNDVTEDREFMWQSEDGSKVLASNIKNGYFVGVGLIYSDEAQDLMDVIESGATSDQLVLPVGGDQRYIDFDLRERIELYNNQLDDYELVESNYDLFFDSIDEDKLQTVEGEFISSSVSKIHRSIYSSRYDHKYMNDKIERRMIYQLEPLMVLAEAQGISYKQGLLDRIWKLLSKNQAHDSAGGCNSDKTNKIIMERFIEADQLSYSAVDYLTRKIAESREEVKENDLVFFNTLPFSRKEIVKCSVSLMSEDFDLVSNGEKLTYQLIETKKENSGSIRKNPEEMDPNKFYYIHDLLVEVDLPALNFTTIQVVEKSKSEEISNQAMTHGIENEFYHVSYSDGMLHLTDKVTQEKYFNFLTIEDSGDEGDTYDYSPPYEDDVLSLNFNEAAVKVTNGPLRNEMKLSGEWTLPKDLEERSNKKQTQSVSYQLIISLDNQKNLLDCHLTIDNEALDHRMRVLVDTKIASKKSLTNTPFGTVEREVVDAHIHDWKDLGWREEPTTIFPMLNYVNLHNETSSVTCFSKGIKEYQIVGDNYDKIALTLFRSVGFLGRPDLIRRPGIASGNEFKYIPTPDSQLQETLTFKFMIQLDGSFNEAKVMKDFQKQVVSVPFYQIQEMNRFTTTLKYFVSNPLPTNTQAKEFLECVSDSLVYSSLRKSRSGDGIEIRLFNPSLTDSCEGGMIELSKGMSYQIVDLKGEALTSVKNNDKIDLGSFKPGEIKTVKLF